MLPAELIRALGRFHISTRRISLLANRLRRVQSEKDTIIGWPIDMTGLFMANGLISALSRGIEWDFKRRWTGKFDNHLPEDELWLN